MARGRQWPLVAAALIVCSLPALAQQLPDGPGKDVVEKQCSTCHSIEVIVAQRNDAAEWKRLVMDMIDRGAEVTDEQVPATPIRPVAAH